jgi:hypothetical protein
LQEFKERVSHKRSIRLTSRLTDAFKQVAIPVSKEEEESEESLLKSSMVTDARLWESIHTDLNKFPAFNHKWPDDVKAKWFEEFDALLKTALSAEKPLVD